MRGTSAPAVAYLVGAAWSIALAAVALRRALELGADPASAVVPRLTVPASVLVAVAVFHPRLRRAVRALKTRTLLVCGGWGVMILLVTLGELEAISRVQVAIVVLFFGLAPLWVAL